MNLKNLITPVGKDRGLAELQSCYQVIEAKPRFYETKALGGHYYMEHYGWSQEQVSALMGHTNVKMTKVYTDRHIQWSEVAVE